ALCGCGTVVLEANYDDYSLRNGPYPYHLKQRIASSYGHLSNRDSAAQCLRLVQKGTRQLVLCHLSQENNTPTMAAEAIAGHLAGQGCCLDRDYRLQVARRSQPSPTIRF
ncbi:MAG: MBL fold metallo-hydrolase, partial [Oscillospiraceae bacterium]|nr:MBL fold metallo-hydrolase [Oscillospiraceae bacterium]